MSITPTFVPLEAPVAVAGTLALVAAAGCACATARPANRRVNKAMGKYFRVIVTVNSWVSRPRLPHHPRSMNTRLMCTVPGPTSRNQDRGFPHYTKPAEHMAIKRQAKGQRIWPGIMLDQRSAATG